MATFLYSPLSIMIRYGPLPQNWVFALSRWLGTSPCDQGGRFCKSQLAYTVIVTILVNICYSLCRAKEVQYLFTQPDPYFFIRQVVSLTMHLTYVMSSLTWAGQSWTEKRNLEYILNKFQVTRTNVDREILLACISAQFLTASLRMIYRGDFWVKTFVMMASCLLQLLDFTIVIQFWSILGTLNDKMASVCKLLRQQMIHVDLHQNLMRFAKSANDVYGLQIMLMLAHTFLVGTTYPYYAFTIISIPGQTGKLFQAVVYAYFLGNVLIKMTTLFMITFRCQTFYSRAEAFNNELFKLMRSNKELCRDNKLFLYVTMRQTVKFTACGFFNLGYPLVTSIIAAATTYLVILLQFSMPSTKQ